MVIKEYKYGQSTVRIHDDCMAKTFEENQAIVERITGLVTKHYQMQQNKEEKTA